MCLPLVLLGLLPSHGSAEDAKQQNDPRQFWSFRALTRPETPRVEHRDRMRTAVDAFVLARLEKVGLHFSSDAERVRLVRRASFDLLGLPPSPEEVEHFVQDGRPDAYGQLLDRLLASPHFGERWGRHWLDGAGYSDVTGTDNDAGIISLSPGKWLYRDYVVRAINEDRSYALFLTEQLAGDEMMDWRQTKSFTSEIREKLVATGFLRNAADVTDAKELNTSDIRHGVWQRTGEVLASNLLGLTLHCAQCHDHKFEPISQVDYYRFLALLAPVYNTEKWVIPKDRALADVAPVQKAEIEHHNAELNKAIDAKKKRLADSKMDRSLAESLHREVAVLEGQRRSFGSIQATYDVGPPGRTFLLKRGNHERPGKEVAPGFPEVLCRSEKDALLPPTSSVNGSSGRRLGLARWLTDWSSPAGALMLRVRVNRIWQHLFGMGLVSTSDNLGLSGVRPTHPELLDWLAAEFRDQGGQLKPFLKLLMMSSVYRQDSASREDDRREGTRQRSDPATIDPDNKLLWRMRLRRLESEALRDAMLVVSGKLDALMGGPPIAVEGSADGRFDIKMKGLPTPTSHHRRSLYLLARRNYHPTFAAAFDQPFMNTNCPCRPSSAVVLQSLAMMNDPFVLEQARYLAERVDRLPGADSLDKKFDGAFRLVLSRPPTPGQLGLCRELYRKQLGHPDLAKLPADEARREALGHLCHMLLSANEFLYVP